MNSGVHSTPTALCTQSREQRARVSHIKVTNQSGGHFEDKLIDCDVVMIP